MHFACSEMSLKTFGAGFLISPPETGVVRCKHPLDEPLGTDSRPCPFVDAVVSRPFPNAVGTRVLLYLFSPHPNEARPSWPAAKDCPAVREVLSPPGPGIVPVRRCPRTPQGVPGA